MKLLIILLLSALAVGARGYVIKVPTSPVAQPGIAPLGWVHIQKLMLPLLENVCEESKNPIIIRLNQDFKQDMTNGSYLKPEVITSLQALMTGKGLLAKGEIFTEYNVDHVNELKTIYEVFYYAKDFDTFYKAACWARQNVNCGVFVDALYMAILNRRDTEKLSIPAPYEILPNYFIRKDFVIKASTLIAGGEVTPSDSIRNDGNAYILDVNYTTNVYDSSDETKLAYFHEDIGLNSYYYLTKLKINTWLNNPRSNGYGEYLFMMIKQLMARYNLERYSNGLDEVEGIHWDYLNVVPYDPMLVYSNGNDFSPRTFMHIESNERLTLLQNIENNIVTVAIHMRESGYTKTEILNHLMEILITSDKSYINLALQMLEEVTTVNNWPSSVLGHYMTTLRDPVFWAINKKMVDLVDQALKVLPVYTKNELYFPGVEVLNVDVKKMTTSFDNYDFDVTEALETGEGDTKFEVKISQSRLNHKPFSIKVNISSLVTQKGLVKIYLGPKVLPGEHAMKKNLFMLLDCFEANFKIGTNLITRNSADMADNSDDFLSFSTIRKKIADAEFGLGSFAMKSIDSQIRFPSRLIIPKGKPEGLPLQIFVFIVPFVQATGGRLVNTEFNTNALLSPGYPLDLDVDIRELFNLPNALVKDIIVTHKGTDLKTSNYGGYVPGSKPWQNADNDLTTDDGPLALALAARPEFTKRQGSFDYKSKKGQYGKKEDYAVKRGEYKKKDFTKPTQRFDKAAVTNDNYKVNTGTTNENFVKHYLYDKTKTNKENVENVVNTDMSFDGENVFILDKTIFDNVKDEELHMNVAKDGNTRIIPDDMLTKNTHKIISNILDNNIENKVNEDYKIKAVTKNDDIILYGLYDKTQLNKDNIDYIVNTDKSFDGGNTFLFDKTIFDKGNDEEVHIDVTRNSNTKTIPDDVFTKDTHSIINKIVDKNIDKKVKDNYKDKTIIDNENDKEIHIDVTRDSNTKTIPDDVFTKDTHATINKIVDKNIDKKVKDNYYDKTIVDKGNDEVEEVHIDITRDSNARTIPDNEFTKESRDIIDKIVDKEVDKEEDSTLANWASLLNKRLSNVYGIVVNPYNIYESDEKVYE